MLAENESLAAPLDQLKAELERLETVPLALRKELDACGATLDEAQSELASAREQLSAVQSERDGLAETLQVAQDQLAGKAIAPVLPATGREARQQPRLRARHAAAGARCPRGRDAPPGRVREGGPNDRLRHPERRSPPELSENLHELSVRFDPESQGCG